MKTLLLPLTGRVPDAGAVATALTLARRLGARVDALFVEPQPMDVRLPVERAALPAALVEHLRRLGTADRDRCREDARHLFTAAAGRLGIDPDAVSWRTLTGPLAEVVAEEARLADLTVFTPDDGEATAIGPAIEAALFTSGRAVLLAPAAEPTATVGACVAVAWDGGAAAARAVMAALPLLVQAEAVTVLTLGGGSGGRAADPRRLVEHLAAHGIDAAIHAVVLTGNGPAQALLDGAAGVGSDALVMGAYGHSRMRELVLGGVTRDMLRRPPPLPVLLAH